MTDTPETPAAKRRRLRLLTIGEVVAVAGLVIAGASYWDTHREAAAVEKPATPAPLLLTGSADRDRAVLKLTPARSDAVLQTQTLLFPSDVRTDTVDTTGDARIENGWIDTALRRSVPNARDTHPPRLPIGIVTTFIDNGAPRRDAAIYDLGYKLRSRLLQPRAVELEGVTLVRRVPVASLRAAVDARWTAALRHGAAAP